MSSDGSTRAQRAGNRRRRRGSEGGGDAQPEASDVPAFSDLQGALKTAASAAAVGAAVGAARAYSVRRHESADDESEPEAEVDLEAEVDEPVAEEQAPEPEAEPEREREHADEPRPEPATRGELRGVVADARRLLQDMHGTDAESVSSVTRNGAGWTIGLEVVEVRRIPDSTDVLATYEVELDGDGGLVRFERVRRYHRSEADRGGR
jgi:Gas vesicle synthesis protein GvpO